MARFGVEAGTGIRVYTDERPNSSAAVLLQKLADATPFSLLSLGQFLQRRAWAYQRRNRRSRSALDAIVAEILTDRPRWDCIRLLELDPSEEGYGAMVRALAASRASCRMHPRRRDMVRGDRRDELQGLPCGAPFATAQHMAPQAAQPRRDRTPGRRLLFGTGAGSRPRSPIIRPSTRQAGKRPSRSRDFMPELIRLAAGLGALRMGVYHIDGLAGRRAVLDPVAGTRGDLQARA